MNLDSRATVAEMRSALAGRPCYGGIDLSSNTDLTASALVFPDDQWASLMRFWLPEDGLEDRSRRDRVPYDSWAAEGWIATTPGNVIDNEFIRAAILEDAEAFDLKECAFDPMFATETSIRLSEAGMVMAKCRQGYATLSEPSKMLETLILNHQLSHGGDPVLRWMAENVSVASDPTGAIRPVKDDKAIYRIDGIVALIMALGRVIVAQRCAQDSVYEDWYDEAPAAEAPEDQLAEPTRVVPRKKSVYEEWE